MKRELQMKKYIVILLCLITVVNLCACGKKVQLEVPIQQEMGDGVVECTLCYGEKEYFDLKFMNHTSYPIGLCGNGKLYQWIDEKWKNVSFPQEATGDVGMIMETVPIKGEKTIQAAWEVNLEQFSLEVGKYKFTYGIKCDGWMGDEWFEEEAELNFEFEIE